MSERIIRDCDGCGALNVATPKVHLPVAWQHDSASARLEERIETLDLCPACGALALAYVANTVGMTVEQGSQILAEIRTWKTKRPHALRP